MEYWAQKSSRFVTPDSHLEVDWGAQERAIKGIKVARRHWVSKQATGFCAVGAVMLMRKERPSAKCPRCPCEEETVEHVYVCPGAKDQWKESLEKLEDWLTSQRTDPDITWQIIQGLTSWQTDPKAGAQPSTSLPRSAQEFIGWRPFLEGCISWEWRGQQQRYYETLNSRKTGRRWVTLLIRKLWDVSWDMWEHRNGILHKADNTVKHQATDQELRRLYALGKATVLRQDRHLFTKPLEEWLLSTPFVRRQWVSMITKSSKRHAKKRALLDQMWAFMRQFLV